MFNKRKLSMVFMVLMFVLYYISTDPDSHILKDLPFGISLVLTLNIFVIAIVGIMVIEFVPDFFIDDIYGKEKETREKAVTGNRAAGLTLIAKSIRILGYCIVVAASIISYNNG